MFHLSDNLYFGRHQNGDVRVLKLAQTPKAYPNVGDAFPNTDVLLDVTIPADGWCSIVASVSRLGEVDNRFYRMQLFHAGR
jgi:hypothetical protein